MSLVSEPAKSDSTRQSSGGFDRGDSGRSDASLTTTSCNGACPTKRPSRNESVVDGSVVSVVSRMLRDFASRRGARWITKSRTAADSQRT